MILKRNDEVISRNGTFSGLKQDLEWLKFEPSIIAWVSLVEKSMPGTARIYEYRTASGDLWELR